MASNSAFNASSYTMTTKETRSINAAMSRSWTVKRRIIAVMSSSSRRWRGDGPEWRVAAAGAADEAAGAAAAAAPADAPWARSRARASAMAASGR